VTGARLYFLILGALWGLMAASRPYLATTEVRCSAFSSP
jgi:hypothetical protein